MAKFQFQNYQDEDVELVIEPWAMSKIVPAGGIIEFEVNDLPPPEIEFCITEKRQPYIYVMSERVRIRFEGKDHEFTSPFRPPIAAFRTMRKLLWS
jgi:hypothetical protein